MAASGEKVPCWHEFTVSAQISKAGPFWSTRQMIQGLNVLIPGFKWRGDASKNAAWVYFSDKTSRNEGLVTIREMLGGVTPATSITAQPAHSGDDRFAVMLMGVTKGELNKYVHQPQVEEAQKGPAVPIKAP